MPSSNRICACLVALLLLNSIVIAEDWPQFRGPRGISVSQSKAKLPSDISPTDHVIWKSTVPAGHSSPIVSQDRIFLTATRDKELLTLGLDRANGKVVWEAKAPYDTLEKIHTTGSYAQSTPATDGEIVVSFFGSSGLHAYDRNGKPLWSRRMGPFKNDFGAGSSPIIVDDRVILLQDHDVDSFIAAYDKKTGQEAWRTDRSEFLRNYATPVVWEVNGQKEIVVAATLRIIGYDLASGKEKWTVTGVSRIINMTPVVAPDNTLIAACWSPGADAGERIEAPSVEELFASDANGDGGLEESEFPDNELKRRFTQIDRDKDGKISKIEYDVLRRIFSDARNAVLAIKPGGTGDITKTHIKWEYTKQIPYCPSPLCYNGIIFMVKDGGIMTALDAETGKILRQARLKSTGGFFASPVAGDGKVFVVNQTGDLSVISAEAEWQELHNTSLNGDGHATPAIVGGRIYVRAGDVLYCFGLPDQTAAR